MNRGRRLPWVAMALLTALAAALSNAPSTTTAPAGYCVGWLETGAQSCFASEPELVAFQEATASPTLITVYRDEGGLQAGGYKNFASAYGKATCTHRYDTNVADASDGNLADDYYSNGIRVNDSISSFRLRAGAGCIVYFFANPNFQNRISLWDTDCLYDCFGSLNDTVSAFKLFSY